MFRLLAPEKRAPFLAISACAVLLLINASCKNKKASQVKEFEQSSCESGQTAVAATLEPNKEKISLCVKEQKGTGSNAEVWRGTFMGKQVALRFSYDPSNFTDEKRRAYYLPCESYLNAPSVVLGRTTLSCPIRRRGNGKGNGKGNGNGEILRA